VCLSHVVTHRPRRVLAALTLAVVVAGCEDTTITPEAAPTTTEVTTNNVQQEAQRAAATAPSTTRATLPPTTAAATEGPLGATFAINPGAHKVTAHAYKVPIRSTNQFNVPDDGHQFAAADVEYCAGPSGDRFGPSSFEFQLAMPDNTRLRSTNSAGLQQPTLESTPLQAGECIRGWINYEVPTATSPRFLIYTSGGAAARWRL
jgi:hypothetical protein